MRNHDNIIDIDDSFDISNLQEGEYLVKSKTSLFKLSEQDFNKIATKVKDPKFNVGDVAYWIEMEKDLFNCDKIKVTSFEQHRESYTYNAHEYYDDIPESELFTLEEAIEKLKEL